MSILRKSIGIEMKLLILLMFISMPASAKWVLVEKVNLEVIGTYTVYADPAY